MKMDETKRLHVGNLPNDVKEKEIRRQFSKFGQISSLEVKHKKASDGSIMSTFAYLDFVASDTPIEQCILQQLQIFFIDLLMFSCCFHQVSSS